MKSLLPSPFSWLYAPSPLLHPLHLPIRSFLFLVTNADWLPKRMESEPIIREIIEITIARADSVIEESSLTRTVSGAVTQGQSTVRDSSGLVVDPRKAE